MRHELEAQTLETQHSIHKADSERISVGSDAFDLQVFEKNLLAQEAEGQTRRDQDSVATKKKAKKVTKNEENQNSLDEIFLKTNEKLDKLLTEMKSEKGK